jgi:hypothetical protein
MSLISIVEAVGAWVLSTALVAATTLWLMRRSLEVSPHHRVRPPLRWMAPATRPARLHQRLRNAMSLARSSVPRLRRSQQPTMVHELLDELETIAVAVDRDLLEARRLPVGSRTLGWLTLTQRVERVERMALEVRALGMAIDSSRTTEDAWLDRAYLLESRISQLRAAQAEVDSVERDGPSPPRRYAPGL